MIKCELTARNYELDDRIKEYVQDKICGLDKYLPRRVRQTAFAEVVLSEDPSGREDNRFVCEAVVVVNGTKMVSREGTVNMYAAIDIVEAKLKVQFLKYKQRSVLRPRRMRMISRLIGREEGTESEDLAG